MPSGKSGSVAIVTGAVGGIGAACARLLAEDGFELILCDLNPDRLTALGKELRPDGRGLTLLAGDIATSDFISQLDAAISDRDVAVLMHTAGLSPTMADPAKIVAVNFDATISLVDAIRPRMADGGCAVLISSSSAYMVPADPFDGLAAKAVEERSGACMVAASETPSMAYPLSKRGVIKLVAAQAAAFARQGARIVSIAPGIIETPMSLAELGESQPMRQMLDRTPLGRMGRPEEIATMAMALCSPAASYVTGCDIKVDGGVLGAMGF